MIQEQKFDGVHNDNANNDGDEDDADDVNHNGDDDGGDDGDDADCDYEGGAKSKKITVVKYVPLLARLRRRVPSHGEEGLHAPCDGAAPRGGRAAKWLLYTLMMVLPSM